MRNIHALIRKIPSPLLLVIYVASLCVRSMKMTAFEGVSCVRIGANGTTVLVPIWLKAGMLIYTSELYPVKF